MRAMRDSLEPLAITWTLIRRCRAPLVAQVCAHTMLRLILLFQKKGTLCDSMRWYLQEEAFAWTARANAHLVGLVTHVLTTSRIARITAVAMVPVAQALSVLALLAIRVLPAMLWPLESARTTATAW